MSVPQPSDRPRVLVTRAQGQSSTLADRLRELGAEPVLIPALEIAPPLSYAALDEAILRFFSLEPNSAGDWLVFTSTNAVDSFAKRADLLKQRSGTVVGPDTGAILMRAAVIGAATARALQSVGLTQFFAEVLLPPQAVAESLAQAMLPYVRQPNGRPTRFLLVRAEEAREIVPEVLRAAGAEVTVVPAYRTVIPQGSAEVLRTLFAEESAVDAISFTSSSSVRNLLALCEAAGVSLPVAALRVSIGPITTQTLRELGYPPHAEASEANVVSLAETVMRVVRQNEV